MQGPPLGEAYPAFQPEPEPLPQVGRRGGGLPAVGPQELPSFASTAAPQPLVHIVCPKGHVLETPREMLGEDAMCPFCQVAFRLRWEDSVEYRKAKEDEILRREQRRGKQWLQWSIAIAVVAVVGLGVLIAMTMSP
jgi:hypothetical protein